MEISTRGRYAVRVLVDIALQDNKFVSISEIAKRQEISIKYLEKIISMLIKSDLLISMRGTNGGYKLVKSPNEYTLKEILDATDDSPKLATCQTQNCTRSTNCFSKQVWDSLSSLIEDFLTNTTLQDIIKKTFKKY